MAGLPCDSSDMKATGKRSAGKPQAAFDEGEPANVARIQLVRHRQTKRAETDRLNLQTRDTGSLLYWFEMTSATPDAVQGWTAIFDRANFFRSL